MRLLPFLAQANGFANGALQHLGLVAPFFQLLDIALDFGKRRTHRRADGAADYQPQ
ncbi:hypothetical protein D3C81_1886640 [compost metagenome]